MDIDQPDPFAGLVKVFIDNARRDVDTMATLEDPFHATDESLQSKRLRMIDRLEVVATVDNLHALIDGYADAEYHHPPPRWLMTLDRRAHELMDTFGYLYPPPRGRRYSDPHDTAAS
ncbi:hypothetical protein AC579_8389 [Pseudocercospora musae]|uniref:Uncharacterized protein n=1 Tax=Pseudocercospora musae TaxID=113226 RepID=A0A139I947_9PEZI|nr:hypothetical protein AC579_8389 [Pseudocercospora musae]